MDRARQTVGIMVLAGAVFSCGTAFVEPHPPVLQRAHASWSDAIRDEPVVLFYILDLHVVDSGVCSSALDALPRAHSVSENPALRGATVAGVLDLSPGCRHVADRRVDADMVRLQLEQAIQTVHVPGAAIRPVVLYVNNSGLQLGSALASDLRALQAPLASRLRPELWGYTSPTIAKQLLLTQSLEWTWAADPELQPRLTAFLEQRLPLQSSSPALDVPVLPDGATAGAVAVKLCAHSREIVSGSIPLNGSAAVIAPSSPPRLRVDWGARLAALPPLLPAPDATWEVELCLDRCDRSMPRADASPGAAWLQAEGCSEVLAQ